MRRPLWEPLEESKRNANITRFIHLVNGRHGLEIKSYPELHRWSVENLPDRILASFPMLYITRILSPRKKPPNYNLAQQKSIIK